MNWATLLYAPVGELLWKKKQALLLRATHKPAIGATICCSGLRMSVQAGLSDDLWLWLVSLGWRELAPGENRLRLKPLATTLVTKLFDAQPDERERVLTNAIRQATRRPSTKTAERAAVS
ncbi:MAG TPA: hypothetical protein VM937_07735 [Burkholderiaceae bacterium]|jgi:hypothetical protein|nr:hypothetical protein [Burkholderiaceae bacterium]